MRKKMKECEMEDVEKRTSDKVFVSYRCESEMKFCIAIVEKILGGGWKNFISMEIVLSSI